MKAHLLISLLLFCSLSFAQDESLGLNVNKNTPVSDTVKSLNFNTQKKGNILIHEDDRIKEITKFIGRESESVDGVKIDGYRIQIFFAESRTSAQSQKASFINNNKGHNAYIDYMAPNYRVRVGDFRSRIEAEAMKQKLITIYPTCIVLKDKIKLPEIKIEQ